MPSKPKTINIRGNEYVPVSERVRLFNEVHSNGSIVTEISYEGDLVRCKATVWPDVSQRDRVFVAHSEEDRMASNINKTSATENAETSAIGRALGLMGLGLLNGIASADEMVKAINRESVTSLPDLERVRDMARRLGSEEARKTLAVRMKESGKYSDEDIAYATST